MNHRTLYDRLSRSVIAVAMLIVSTSNTLLFAAPAKSESSAVLTLDGLSFVSFQDAETYSIPGGSTLTFRFGSPRPDGTVQFTISPDDVSIAPIELDGGGTLAYAFTRRASGVLKPSAEGYILEFDAVISATLENSGKRGKSYVYSLPFTTETLRSRDLTGRTTIERKGARLVDGVGYVQLVAATTNKKDAVPEPGSAVYAVLSGRFDELPL